MTAQCGSAVLVHAQEVGFSYGLHRVLIDVSLSFSEGETVAIMGASGSGKTTLLYALAGLEHVAEGSVSLLGNVISELSPDALSNIRLRSVGFVFQSADLVPELTLRENVALPLELAGVSRRATARRVNELLGALELEDCALQRPREVSGGQAQRCAVARAVVASPAVVFADEPTGALDSTNRDRVLDLLLQQVRACGALLIAVTHDGEVAARFKRRVVLHDGRIISDSDVAAAVVAG